MKLDFSAKICLSVFGLVWFWLIIFFIPKGERGFPGSPGFPGLQGPPVSKRFLDQLPVIY